MSEMGGGSLSLLTDGELVGLAQKGERPAFEELFHRHRDRLYTLALGITGDQNEAGDVVQETFLRAYKRLHALEKDRSLIAYLCRTASNTAIDVLRARRQNKTVSLDEHADLGLDAQAVRLGPDGTVIRDHQAAILMEAVVALPEDQRVVIVLHHLEDIGIAEISERLKIPAGTVKSRLGRGREILRKKLEGKV